MSYFDDFGNGFGIDGYGYGGGCAGYSILLTSITYYPAKETACAHLPYFTFPQRLYACASVEDLIVGDKLYTIPPTIEEEFFNGEGKWWPLFQNQSIGSEITVVKIGYDGTILEKYDCNTGTVVPDPEPIPDPTPPPPPVVPSPVTGLTYKYFVLENLSFSKKIFAYYSGSQNYDYTYSPTTSSADPGEGFFRLNSGSIGSGGDNDESETTEIFIDIKDNNGEEDIITYLTSLSASLAKTGTPATPYGEVQFVVSGSDKDLFYHRFDLQNVEFLGSSPATNGYFKLDVSNIDSVPNNNPLSSSIAAGSGSNIIVHFFNDIIPGYHEKTIFTKDKEYVVACDQQEASYGSGSISQPFAIDWGLPESEFLETNFYPTQPGYAWLWNDGYKVKHIKMSNISFTGDELTDFIKKSLWSRFILFNPTNAQGNYLYPSDGNYPETFYLHNVTKYNDLNYSHLFVNQDNPETTFAVDSENFASTNHNFLAEGSYIIRASSGGSTVEPTIKTDIIESIPQGYFPSASSNYPVEQFFRGWAGANYYNGNSLVPTNGKYFDPLLQFETGSTERDYDGAPDFLRSQLPFFINATSSYIPISSSNFDTYTSQQYISKIGPTFNTEGGNTVSYYYDELTGKILIEGAEYLDVPKTTEFSFRNSYDIELISPANFTQTYATPDNQLVISVPPSQSLWLTRGKDSINAGDTNRYQYNRFFHRPYKAYLLLSTGSDGAGYGEDEYGLGVYGSGSVPIGENINEVEKVFIHYSQSSADLRKDGIYTFDTRLNENVGLTASINLSYEADEIIAPTKYGESLYGDSDTEYGQNGTGESILTWRTASLKIYKNSSTLTTKTVYLEPEDIEAKPTIDVEYLLTQGQISTGDTLKLSLEVDTTDTQAFNSSLIVTSYTMSIGATTPPTDDKIPVTFNNYLELNDDCDPTLANVFDQRPNARLQDVDYSVDVLSPINFDQIITNTAVRADVPESNYTQTGYADSRYEGTRSNTTRYNIHTPGDTGTFGKVSNIDINKAYFAYFDKIYDLYPIVEGTTTLNIKYVFDAEGNRFNPRLGSFNFFNLEGTFEPESTLILSNNAKEDEALQYLNTKHIVKSVGLFPTPILYTQIGGREYTSSINFTGQNPPQPEPPEFNDYSFTATGSDFPAQLINFPEQQLSPNSGISGSGVNVTQSYFPSNGDIVIPDTDHLAPNGAGNNKVTSDTYTLDVEHIFETNPTKRVLSDAGDGFFEGADKYATKVGEYYFYGKVNGQPAKISNFDVTLQLAYRNSNVSSGIEFKTFSYSKEFPNNVKISNNKLNIIFKSNDIDDYVKSKGWSTEVSGDNNGNENNRSYNGTWFKSRWIINANISKRGSGGFFSSTGTGFKQGDTINMFHSGEMRKGDTGRSWDNFFFATYTDNQCIQSDTFNFRGIKNNPPQGALAPYWVFDTSGGENISDTLIMSSIKANEAYGINLKQEDLPYSASTWPKFPRGIEPDFVQFPSITEEWSLKLGDEIKFENNESLVYKINSITPPSANGGELKITVQPPIENQTINKDFFVIRRFVEEKGTLILSTPKPYTFPVTASTSPGLILPEFPTKEIDKDPDAIIKDLEDKKLIE
jgi:hypothetical protein